MSFVGGGADCSANGNTISQFNKHTQADRSLQRQAVQAGLGGNVPQFKRDDMMNNIERQNLEQFMQNDPNSNFQFESMKNEINRILPHVQGKTQGMQPPMGDEQWTREFTKQVSPGMTEPMMKGADANYSWSNEFQRGEPAYQQPSSMNRNPSMYMGNYRPMMGMGMPMMRTGGFAQQGRPMEQMNNQGSEIQVDWDDQFNKIEELASDVVADEGEPIHREPSPEIEVDDKYEATFQEVWDSLNLEEVENDFINEQYEEFKRTQGQTYPPDMSQWERDFMKYASSRSSFGEYKFEAKEENQYLDLPADQDPYEIGIQLMENGARLSEAALAFEAAIQRDGNHVDAWLKLGEVQTQNEKEIAGISALERCLELSPEHSEALMDLAISYINEGYDNAAFATLERWISTKYPQVVAQAKQQHPEIGEDRIALNKRVTELFIEAARLSPNLANMDADVQMGLGVLFYAAEEFEKTIDCFNAALSIRPDDPILLNRLGASLANSNRPEEAVNAYLKALELKPTFVRARYNLGVSCINIGCYKEAAEHLLNGLAMHQVEGVDNERQTTLTHNQSTSLTETLKRAFIGMDRRELLAYVKPGMDLNVFRDEFSF